jgi:putative hemolysin
MSLENDSVFALNWKPAGPVKRVMFAAARPVLERALGLVEISRRYGARPHGVHGDDFAAWVLEAFGAELRIDPADLERVPSSGPALVVANHPFGAVEGVALAHALRRVRPDVKLLANLVLGRIPELRDLFLFVDPFERPGSQNANASSLRRALAWLRGGGMLVVFPAGEVASLDLKTRRVVDPAWSPTIAGLARRTGAPTIPIFIPGRNGALFQTAGLLHPALRTALLPRQLLGSAGRVVELRVGKPIPAARLIECGDDARAIAYMRDRTEILAAREGQASLPAAIQPRRTPASVAPVVPPVDPALLAAEVATLPEVDRLTESEDLQVFVARARAIPNILREIGRLREVTFRDVGEGTGREIDLDAYDASYLHLFIWNRVSREIIGAYRLGPTDEIVPARGVEGLYTASLFRYDPRLFDAMGPALEMGRSWVRTEHQKSYVGLMLLWKGIGEFVGRHPRYATLFGPVSISAEYRSASQQLIKAFLERNRKMTDWAKWVRPTNPFREPRGIGQPVGPASLADLEDVSTFISEIEADQKGVPVLLKQYMKLEGRLLAFNVDPDFSNVLDVLIVVDLRRTAPKILQRYLGRANLERFQAFHGASRVEGRAS